jgi:bisphosphoglycerate-independent phosphoglycerate mutase (AlkP superfamily)
MASRPKPLLLLIFDGFGIRQENTNNITALAATLYWHGLAPAMLAILGIKPTSEITGLSLIGE